MLKSDCWSISFLLLLWGQPDLTAACSEHAVKKAIFDGYDNQLRPVKNQATVTHLTVDMTIYSIVSINEQDEKIELLTWTHMTWTDEFLQWNAADFGGCEEIYTSASTVWMPDYFVSSLLETEDIISEEALYATVFSNGTIAVSVPQHATLRCIMDITEFPFDTQNCTITGGPWWYSSDQVVVHMYKDRPEGVPAVRTGSSEFDTISFTGVEHTGEYSDQYSEIILSLVLKRRPEYYIFVLFIPSFLLTMLCIIGIFTPNSSDGGRNEKMTLGLTTLLSMAVILNITADAMPKSAKGLPLLGYYVLYEIGMCSLSTILSTVIICVHERANRENWNPPAFLRWMASIPSLWDCIRRVLISGKENEISNNVHKASTSKENLTWNEKYSAKNKESGINSSLRSTIEGKEMMASLQQIISRIDEHLKNLNDREERMGVWATALAKIDLFLLVILLIANCVLTYVTVVFK